MYRDKLHNLATSTHKTYGTQVANSNNNDNNINSNNNDDVMFVCFCSFLLVVF